MSNITIVTAFYDIGRGNWTTSMEQRGGPLPHYLHRTNDVYFERFANICKLENEMVIFTSADFADRVMKIREDLGRKNQTKVIVVDIKNQFSDVRAQIRATMDDPTFPQKINPYQLRNPEYWCEDYVLVTSLKSWFVNQAIESGVSNEMVAWIDFGYARTAETVPSTKWSYDFNPEKIHFFNCKEPNLDKPGEQIGSAVVNNDVIIFGAMVVANKIFWPALAKGMQDNLQVLMQSGLVDDDQGLFLMCYFGNPAIFELHPTDYNDPFIVFRNFNQDV